MYKNIVFLILEQSDSQMEKSVNLSMDCKSENVIYCAICPLKNFKFFNEEIKKRQVVFVFDPSPNIKDYFRTVIAYFVSHAT